MSRRIPYAIVVSLLVVAGATEPVLAHVGGHDVPVGVTLHIWTDPQTGEAVPGSVLFLSGDRVHVEDAAGRVHVWPSAALSRDDRAVVEGFRARTATLNGVQAAAAEPQAAPISLMYVWLAAVAGIAAWLMFRAGLSRTAIARAGVASLALALPLACGGGGKSQLVSSPTAPTATLPPTMTAVPPTTTAPAAPAGLASFFTFFPEHVRTREDSQYLFVESDGLADHVMMAGIRSWQQQVPLPAAYTGSNAWRIPLNPRLADQPVSARTGLFRGAIALAVNGVPIFNALNNRGDDAFLFGELDDFGGHAGRADDYHYHTAPLFLSTTVGATKPIAVGLDGFLLYGSVEPDGSPMRALDEYNGHTDSTTTYHYHGTKTYPYINGGMKGVVTVSDQVEPQPSLNPVRPAGTPLAGATITRHASTGANAWTLEYQITGRTYKVDYRVEGTRYTFVFTDPSGATRTETYGR
jgi:YHYH protein